MIPLHKYLNPFLGKLKLSSGAFILLVDVTTLRVKLICGKLDGYDLERHTHILIKGLTADNAYQSKN